MHDEGELRDALVELREVYRQPVLVEEFIDGDELTVGLVGNRPDNVLGIMRVLPRQVSDEPFVYGLEAKRDWRQLVRYECPAQLSKRDSQAVREAALTCWRALGCRDVARIDFRLRDGVPYFLEANPLPGLSPVSGDLVILAGSLGIEYLDLVACILRAATDRLDLACETSLATRD
jgi:D-alanine-D-alanine ligase